MNLFFHFSYYYETLHEECFVSMCDTSNCSCVGKLHMRPYASIVFKLLVPLAPCLSVLFDIYLFGEGNDVWLELNVDD